MMRLTWAMSSSTSATSGARLALGSFPPESLTTTPKGQLLGVRSGSIMSGHRRRGQGEPVQGRGARVGHEGIVAVERSGPSVLCQLIAKRGEHRFHRRRPQYERARRL